MGRNSDSSYSLCLYSPSVKEFSGISFSGWRNQPLSNHNMYMENVVCKSGVYGSTQSQLEISSEHETYSLKKLRFSFSLLRKLDALSQKTLKQEINRSNTIYPVLWNTHCHIHTHSSVFFYRWQCRESWVWAYKFFWWNFFMLCEVIDRLGHFKSLQSLYSFRIILCSVRQFNRTEIISL